MMRHACIALSVALISLSCAAQPPVEEKGIDIALGGKTVARTMNTPYDKANAEVTYKVYTHLFDPGVGTSITKGTGGKYPHHRGLFIGWNHTTVEGAEVDTWHMKECVQVFSKELDFKPAEGHAGHKVEVNWNHLDGKTFIREERTIDIGMVGDGVYSADFTSRLESLAGPITLRGDLQHAGMHFRLADEVANHEDSTSYVLPEGAKVGEDDSVTNAWWACCLAEVGGKRYSVLHMTPKSNPGGVKEYSIRKYARCGSFNEYDLAADKPLELRYRIVWTDKPLDQAACQKLYDEYSK